MHPTELLPVLKRWSTCDDMWLRRTSIIAQLQSRDALDIGLLYGSIDVNDVDSQPFGREFFVQKAIGWALRTRARSHPSEVRAFLERKGALLSNLSRREASKHIGEDGAPAAKKRPRKNRGEESSDSD